MEVQSGTLIKRELHRRVLYTNQWVHEHLDNQMEVLSGILIMRELHVRGLCQ